MSITFECAHEGTRTGIVVQVDGVYGPRVARWIGELAFELAGEQAKPQVTDPGWWALMFGRAALESGPARVQRVVDRADTHVTVQVARGRLIEVRPDWPLVRMGDTCRWIDLRSEAALRHGPSDRELREYAESINLDPGESLTELGRMFDLGVIEWHRDHARDRVMLRGAGS